MIAIILVILFDIFTTINSYISSCGNSSTCECSFTSLDALKMDYDDNMGIEMIVDFSEWSRLEVVCNGTHKLEDFKHTSKLPGKTINSLSIISCVLSKKTSLKEFVEKIGVLGSKKLSYQSFKKNYTLVTRDHLKGIMSVKELVLSHNSLFNISSEFFADFSDLEKLDLSHNNFNILLDIFNATPNLKNLDLRKNLIATMSPTVFNNLQNLEHLDFGYNQFRYIHGNSFNKLVSLKSLSLKANEIGDIPWDLFSKLKKLESIDISDNRFVSIPQLLFNKNRNLRRVLFNNNTIQLLTLPNHLFLNLEILEEIYLNNDGLLYLPENLFTGSFSLKYVNLGNNNITYLKQNIFQGLKNLEVLKINNNEIKIIPTGIFADLEKLTLLDLSFNIINFIPRGLFGSLTSLIELNMENNHLKYIEHETFTSLKKLIIARFSNNQLDFINATKHVSIFYSNNHLKELHFANNSIQNFFADWSISFNLTFLNLSHNHINTISKKDFHFPSNKILVDLRYNKINNIVLDNIEATVIYHTVKRDVKVLIDHNPILCDCHLYHLMRYFHNEMPTFVYNYIEIVAENLTCFHSYGRKMRKIEELNSTTYTCPEREYFKIDTNCPFGCSCSLRMADKTRILDCSNKNLSDFAIDVKRVYFVNILPIILNFTGNALTRIPSMDPLDSINVTEFLLSNNRIFQISIDELFLSLKVLELHNNSITRIDSNVIKYFSPSFLYRLTLSGNPIICDCNSLDLHFFVYFHRFIYTDLNNLICLHTNVPMYKLKPESFCTPVLGLNEEWQLNEREAINQSAIY